jgi:predicted ArsR family transcriptional regulator
MAEIFGERRKRLLRHLLRTKTGATVKELVQVLGVTRTAVRQHLAALARDGLVAPGGVQPSGGRPKRLLVLTAAARERLPRYYSWFGELVMEAVEDAGRTTNLGATMRRIAGAVVAEQGPRPRPDAASNVESLAVLMDRLGYDARSARAADGAPTIEADNCVFHDLAKKHPAVCQFDLAVLSAYTGQRVALQECMVRGGRVCRFRFTPRPS